MDEHRHGEFSTPYNNLSPDEKIIHDQQKEIAALRERVKELEWEVKRLEPAERSFDRCQESKMLLNKRVALLTEALRNVTAELKSLIEGEYDDPSVGIKGWNSLHDLVASAEALTAQPLTPKD